MSKKVIQLFLIIIISFSCNDYKTTEKVSVPNKFKVGKFKYYNEEEGIIVEKTMTKQIEYNTKTNYKIEFKVIWKSDNEYNMIFLGGTKGCLKIKDTINVKIISWKNNSYNYEAFDKRCLGKSYGKLVKI